MTDFATSADGTRIAFDRLGNGPSIVLVGGMFSDRETGRELAERLADRFTVFTFDRRGRRDSGNTLPYAVAREVEDIAALIAAAGGASAVYGHSSGAALALEAAASGLPISRLVLHEPPYGGDDEESVAGARALAVGIETAIAADRRADAIVQFMTSYGLPPDAAAEMGADPKLLALAPTMLHDFAVLGERERGGVIPAELVARVTMPTLLLAGTASPEFFRDTARRMVELLPDGAYAELEGQDHGAAPEVLAPVIVDFLAARMGAV